MFTAMRFDLIYHIPPQRLIIHRFNSNENFQVQVYKAAVGKKCFHFLISVVLYANIAYTYISIDILFFFFILSSKR